MPGLDGLTNFANSLNNAAGSINNVATGVGNVMTGVANIEGAMINVGVAAGAYSYPYQPYYQGGYGTDTYTPGNMYGGSSMSTVLDFGGKAVNGGLNAYYNSAAVAAAIKGAFGGGKAVAGAVQATEAAAAGAAGAVSGTAAASTAATSTAATATVAASKGFIGGIGAIGKAVMKGTGLSAAIGAGVSLVTNGIDFSQGRITGGRLAGNVVADTGGAVVSGAGAALTGGLAALALGGAATGAMMLVPIAAGVLGYLGVDFLWRKSGIRDGISNAISGAFGGG